MSALLSALRWIEGQSILFSGDEAVFGASVCKGTRSRIAVVAGDNASGKSLLVRILSTHLRLEAKDSGKKPVHNISLSIRERTGAGTDGMGGFRKMMMFGDEETSSTGAISASSVALSFQNMATRNGVLILDEPEIGLSQGYAAAMGTLIGRSAQALPRTCAGTVVVTHSKPLVEALVEEIGGTPIFVHTHPVGAPAVRLKQWLEQAETRTVEELLALPDVGHTGFRAAQDLINAVP